MHVAPRLSTPLLLCVACFCCAAGKAAPTAPTVGMYIDDAALGQRLRQLASAHRHVDVTSVGSSAQGGDVWVVELGAGDAAARAGRPGLLVAAGIDGDEAFGTEVVLSWLDALASGYGSDPKIRELLDTTTIYAFPRVSPDAGRRLGVSPLAPRTTNARPVDEDHDGLVDEDGPEDLNGDGVITMMRVEDPRGEYLPHPAEPRILVEADPTKNEAGRYRLWLEGRDDDGDEAWNEDPGGGVDVARNFPFGYPHHEPTAGLFQMSEPESKALADFVLDHANVSAAVVFGHRDNLTSACDDGSARGAGSKNGDGKPPEADGRWSPPQPATEIATDDRRLYAHLGQAFRDAAGLHWATKPVTAGGSFTDWMYFHRGRLALAVPAWSPTLQLAADGDGEAGKRKCKAASLSDEKGTAKEKGENAGKGKGKGKAEDPHADDPRAQLDRDYLAWVDAHAPERFVPWRAVKHPDLPGQTVEIGGFAPLARTSPPDSQRARWRAAHARFLTELGQALPRVAIRKVEVEDRTESVYAVTIEVENRGYMPTISAHGEQTRLINPTRVEIELPDAAFLGGQRVSTTPILAGRGGFHELEYVIHVPRGRKKIPIRVVSALGGTATGTIDLREAKAR